MATETNFNDEPIINPPTPEIKAETEIIAETEKKPETEKKA